MNPVKVKKLKDKFNNKFKLEITGSKGYLIAIQTALIHYNSCLAQEILELFNDALKEEKIELM